MLNRQPSQLDVRTYRRDGTLLGGRQFAADVHVLAHGGDHFLLIAHGVSGNFGGTDVNPDLTEATGRSWSEAQRPSGSAPS